MQPCRLKWTLFWLAASQWWCSVRIVRPFRFRPVRHDVDLPELGRTPSELNRLIAPEIRSDRLWRELRQVAALPVVRTILEIGSSSGEGSTSALVEGARRNVERPQLFCLEVSTVRFRALEARYRNEPSMFFHNLSSVPASAFPTAEAVTAFHRQYRPKLRRAPIDLQIQWLRQDLAYLNDRGGGEWGIRQIRAAHGIDVFDLVLIDGSEFTGGVELNEVYGAGFLALDDILTFKNHLNYRRLRDDPDYRLVTRSRWRRNGFAIFRRVMSERSLSLKTAV